MRVGETLTATGTDARPDIFSSTTKRDESGTFLFGCAWLTLGFITHHAVTTPQLAALQRCVLPIFSLAPRSGR